MNTLKVNFRIRKVWKLNLYMVIESKKQICIVHDYMSITLFLFFIGARQFTQTHNILGESNLRSLLIKTICVKPLTNYFKLSITMYIGKSVHVYCFIHEFYMPFLLKETCY